MQEFERFTEKKMLERGSKKLLNIDPLFEEENQHDTTKQPRLNTGVGTAGTRTEHEDSD